jgi:glycosyltransferase involved in cell wall biosynthesis
MINNSKLLIFVLTYNHEKFITKTLDLIPHDEIKDLVSTYEILISDDFSHDLTAKVVKNYIKKNPNINFQLISQSTNLGYGGNQKFGYNYAIINNFDIVLMLHGDGQYSPLLIPSMILPIINQNYEVVLGSRMIDKNSALKGKMPLYKFFGNIAITLIQNILLKQNLSEYHTGLRVYKIDALSKIPFNENNNGFSFDTDILIQAIDNKFSIKEISIPTHYGTEYCNVNVIKYGLMVLFTTFASRLQKMGLINLAKFNYKNFRNHKPN